jgi:CBS domain-containing protein
MAFVSEFIGKPVIDLDGERIGTLGDIVARFQKDLPHPVIVGLIVKGDGGIQTISYAEVTVMNPVSVALSRLKNDLKPFILGEEDFFLVEDVMDKQIIDTNDARVVRANDLELIRVGGAMVVSNVDIGTSGILRRIGLEKLVQKIAKSIGRPLRRSVISLDAVELVPHEQSLRLRIPRNKITSLHPADLAEILSDLNRSESGHLLESLDTKALADALEEVEPDFQASLIRDMSDEKVADVLEEMEPDEAADLLAELTKERSDSLLGLMNGEEAKDIRKLLTFPVESAGGIMTTEFVSVHGDLTASQVITFLRKTLENAHDLGSYLYIVDDENTLMGVISLSDLILAQPNRKVMDFMRRRVVSVRLLDEQEKVAQVIAKYNLLAVPVVDHHNTLHGIVTADDAIDVIIPTAWKKRLPRMYH